MKDFLKESRVERLASGITAAASNYTDADIIDTQDCEGVLIVAVFGTSATDNGMKIQQDTDPAHGADPQDLEGTSLLLDGTEKMAVIDIYRPRERYLKPVILRGTSTTIDSVIAIKYGGRVAPIDNNSDSDVAAETHISPAEGTA